jgi:hypothetical protein
MMMTGAQESPGHFRGLLARCGDAQPIAQKVKRADLALQLPVAA